MPENERTIDVFNPEEWRWRGPAEALRSTEADPAVTPLLEKLEQTSQDQLILRLMANSAGVFRPFVLLADGLVNRGTFPADDREVVVLHLAIQLGLPYEWHSHVSHARDAGLGLAQIEALRSGEQPSAELFSPSQVLAISLCNKLTRARAWDDDDWDRATAIWGETGALELVLCIGWWAGMVATVLDALDLVPRST